MGHEEHISSGVVVVVEGVVVDVGKHGSSSKEGSVGLVEMNAESSDEGEGGKGRVDGGAGRGSGSRGVDGRLGGESGKDGFEGFDHGVGLSQRVSTCDCHDRGGRLTLQ